MVIVVPSSGLPDGVDCLDLLQPPRLRPRLRRTVSAAPSTTSAFTHRIHDQIVLTCTSCDVRFPKTFSECFVLREPRHPGSRERATGKIVKQAFHACVLHPGLRTPAEFDYMTAKRSVLAAAPGDARPSSRCSGSSIAVASEDS